MAEFVFPPAAQPSVAVAGSEARFPVRRIFCVGRNYAAHAREMGQDPDREPPFFFSKPGDAVVDSGAAIPYPSLTEDLHHEIELVVAIGKGGSDIEASEAPSHVFGYAVGIDLTRRDLQGEAKKMGRPWDWAKAFDRSAPCGAITQVDKTGHPAKGRIWLAVNGTVRQDGDLAELIWPVADVIALCSRAMELKPGDLIYTGTPAGVGALKPGDRVEGGVDGVGEIAITISAV
ncbi:fumarylacetoacetate hydrolase family protein [Nitratireductor sp. ZSWI3]|uniref:fumarylacetoacetate hydrolase family protein n=1 Tax=Nitratireductor sp. ZSWI3 TaxID=2966359 RepID=UPI00214F922A|nr:fumarylacetoacetate hydrolase family protein [Nitratireductor sp. ZSWI3]MCR4267976.1 fumarylacetoacetate hydrolase family protein [Nitratireductor sp. ZSWI3]